MRGLKGGSREGWGSAVTANGGQQTGFSDQKHIDHIDICLKCGICKQIQGGKGLSLMCEDVFF